MKELVTLLLMFSSLELFSQTIYYVTPAGNDDNNGSSWATPFRTLQKALATSTTGQVWVAAGTYYPDEGPGQVDNDRFATFNLKTGVAIYGGFIGNETDTSQRNWKTNLTILSENIDKIAGNTGNAYHVVRTASLDSTAIIDGFTITGGNADGDYPSEYYRGGGMYNYASSSIMVLNCSFSGNTAFEGGGIYTDKDSSFTLVNCSFLDNSAEQGGGLFNNAFSSTITNCSVIGNQASFSGGGIFIGREGSGCQITDCIITDNRAVIRGGGISGSCSSLVNCRIGGNVASDSGGGIFNPGNGSITNCSFDGNFARFFGGAIYNSGSSPVITGCSFTGNVALLFGGGIFNYQSSSPVIISCSFSGNEGWQGGGAICNNGGYTPYPRPANNFKGSPGKNGKTSYKNNAVAPNIINCTFWRNQSNFGGGMYNIFASPSVTNCSFSRNDGEAIYDDGYSVITNSILWGNSGLGSYFGLITWSILENLDGWPDLDTTNLDADPLFVDEANGDLRLRPGSPAIDAGNNAAVTTTTDADGNPRIAGARVDMGAYEYLAPITLTCPAMVSSTIFKNTSNDDCVYTIQSTELDVLVGGSSVGPFTYSYILTGATTTTDTVVSTTLDGVSLTKGETGINWLVRDTGTNEASCSFKVMVTDSTPPVISSVTTNTPILFPPDHKMHDITLAYSATDNCGPVTTTLSVSSNEPEIWHPPHSIFVDHAVILGNDNTGDADWELIDNHHLKLRAENAIRGNGRIYTITITTTDADGNTATATTTVSVPRNITRPLGSTGLVIKARPNPSTHDFGLVTYSSSDSPMRIKVVDNVGRVIETRTGVTANGTLFLGSKYYPGLYYVEIIQGSAMQTLKLVKQAR